jgi:prepilin-type N-terminal cleavage/methylation domain-containing protein
MWQKGFSLVELIIVVVIIGVLATIVVNQIGLSPREKSRDAVKKQDINKIADAYDQSAVDGISYRPIGGKAPLPPEGGTYQGLLAADAGGYKICAQLEKGKDINCLENSDNPNCYCRSSHTDNGSGNLGYNNGGGNGNGNGGGNPSPSPTPVACNVAKPASLVTNYPGGSTNSIVGTDGTWCRDLDAGAGNTTMVNKGTCEDSCVVHEDYCQSSTTNRDWYCSGTWNGTGWTNAHCEAGGYVCNSGYACSDGACRQGPNPFGQAIAVNGKPAYLNPPSYNPLPEYMKANYDPKMNLTTEQVTVEAWIKPTAPTTDAHHYRIVDNTYRLTMHPRPNGENISYKYYFDVQSVQNGPCGQTVVQSDSRLASDPWNINYYKTVTKSEFENWKHVVGIFKDSIFYIYENGILLNTYNTVGSGHSYMNICNDGRAMHVGAGLFGKSTPYYDNFQGLIDEVRISDVVRYSGSSYTVPKLPFSSDANTDMLYHFDGNTTDSSSNGLSGQTTGTIEYVNSTVPTN